nr:hypothetical protein [uncultured Cupriavidus sp.]
MFGIAAAALIIYLLRAQYQFANPQFWAEDATIFFADSPWQAVLNIVKPYAGYFHIGPRTLALISAFFPGNVAPTAMLWAACASAVICACVQYALADFLPLPNRVLFALAPLLALPGGEIYGNATNSQWFFGALLGALILCFRQGRFSSWRWMALAAFLSLTGPFSVFLFPVLCCWALLLGELRTNRRLLVIVGGCALIQTGVLISVGANKYGSGIAPPLVWLQALQKFAETFTHSKGAWAMLAMLPVLGLPFATVICNRHKLWLTRDRLLPLAFVMVAGLTLLVGLTTHKHQPDLLGALGPGERYFLQPIAFLLMALACAVRVDAPKWNWIGVVLVVALIMTWGSRLKIPRQPDLHWQDYFALSRIVDDAVAPILPNWSLSLYRRSGDRKLDSSVFRQDVEIDAALSQNLSFRRVSGVLEAVPGSADPQLFLDMPQPCRGMKYRFLRMGALTAIHAQLYLPKSSSGDFSELLSQQFDIGAGEHRYFDVPKGHDVGAVRLDINNNDAVVRAPEVAWTCFD